MGAQQRSRVAREPARSFDEVRVELRRRFGIRMTEREVFRTCQRAERKLRVALLAWRR